jgi:hypothetical protein
MSDGHTSSAKRANSLQTNLRALFVMLSVFSEGNCQILSHYSISACSRPHVTSEFYLPFTAIMIFGLTHNSLWPVGN